MFPCSHPAVDRTIPLKVIAERTKLSIEDVEHLLMKSLSVSSNILQICFALSVFSHFLFTYSSYLFVNM